MPKFHFDLVDTRTGDEEDWLTCQSKSEVQVMATQIAGRLLASEPIFLRGYSVLVTNEEGHEVFRARLRHTDDEPKKTS